MLEYDDFDVYDDEFLECEKCGYIDYYCELCGYHGHDCPTDN